MLQERRKALSQAAANNRVVSARGDAESRDREKSDGFKEGAIVRIKLDNILTYESVEFCTGPSLNVIIGPNGTGKSAIVCAICLGLAGKTSWLGRASSPADFIRYGSDKGTIELELYNGDGDNYVIRREISKGKGRENKVTSNWWVNGRAANLKSVEEMVARLNIQVGNLVQFLPQEKVAEFARMSQQELLESTEKAVGSVEMHETHQRLIQMGQQTLDIDKRLETLRSDLDTEVQKNNRLEPDIRNFRERERFLEKIDLLKKKRPWMEYQQLKQVFEDVKQQRDVKADGLKVVERKHEPLLLKKNELERLKTALDSELKQKTQEIRANANKVSESSRDLENMDEQIQVAKSDLEMKQTEEDRRKKKYEDLSKQLAALEAELRQVEGANETQLFEEIQKVDESMRVLKKDINGINQQGSCISTEVNNLRREVQEAQQELRLIQDVGNQRLEQLRRAHKHTYDAVQWLRQNRDKFKATIHEPIILCLHMHNPDHAKFVEMQISANDMRTFVCEDSSDLELFMRIMRDEQRLKINAALVPDRPADSFHPDYPIDTIRPLGFISYLRELFQCPDPVMAFLCMLYQVHKIPVGDDSAHRNVERIIKAHPDLRMFYTSRVQYSIKKSKYGGAVSSRNTPLRDVRFLAASVDKQREQVLLHTVQTTQRGMEAKETVYRDLQRQQQEKERELNALRDQKRDLSKQKDQKGRLEQNIRTKRESIRRVEGEALDMEGEDKLTKKKIIAIISKKCDNLATMHQHTQRCFELSKQKVGKSLQQAETNRKFSNLEQQLRSETRELEALKTQVEALKQQVKDAKQRAREKLEEAKRMTNTQSGTDLAPELKQVFETFPQTIEELDDEIHRHQARADSIFQIDESVITQYQARETQIGRMRTALEEEERRERSLKGDVSEMRNQWLNPLTALVDRINTNFSYFFSAMGCNGEVDLNIPEDKEAYNKYGVRIRVKFRDTESLKELTPFHQSGGERSVATVLYMMSLQELARCPFRCVDEINQGMDPVNERKVFELVVQTVCRKDASQYFLLTPKLLPDLEYADNMTVLCVNNGPHIMNHKQWDLRAFIRKGAELS